MSELERKAVLEPAGALPETRVYGKAAGAARNSAARPAPPSPSPRTEPSAAADAPRTAAAAPGPAPQVPARRSSRHRPPERPHSPAMYPASPMRSSPGPASPPTPRKPWARPTSEWRGNGEHLPGGEGARGQRPAGSPRSCLQRGSAGARYTPRRFRGTGRSTSMSRSIGGRTCGKP
jgi:hypothetical protein